MLKESAYKKNKLLVTRLIALMRAIKLETLESMPLEDKKELFQMAIKYGEIKPRHKDDSEEEQVIYLKQHNELQLGLILSVCFAIGANTSPSENVIQDAKCLLTILGNILK